MILLSSIKHTMMIYDNVKCHMKLVRKKIVYSENK